MNDSTQAELDIDHLAKLARIELKENDREKLLEQMKNIVQFCSTVCSIDTQGLEPMVHTFEHEENFWDEDVCTANIDRHYLTQNAPQMEENQLVVPKVL